MMMNSVFTRVFKGFAANHVGSHTEQGAQNRRRCPKLSDTCENTSPTMLQTPTILRAWLQIMFSENSALILKCKFYLAPKMHLTTVSGFSFDCPADLHFQMIF